MSPWAWLKGWQHRHVVLDGRKLKYFKNQESEVPKGVINFDHMNCKVEKIGPLRFDITLSDRTFSFRTDTEELCQ
jgi:hypothetical protein